MMKSLAEQLREFMNTMIENFNPDYDLTLTVGNWREPTDADTEETYEMEVEVGVNYTVSGYDRPATFDSPAEYADVELEGVYLIDSGDDVTTEIPEAIKAEIMSAVNADIDDLKRNNF